MGFAPLSLTTRSPKSFLIKFWKYHWFISGWNLFQGLPGIVAFCWVSCSLAAVGCSGWDGAGVGAGACARVCSSSPMGFGEGFSVVVDSEFGADRYGGVEASSSPKGSRPAAKSALRAVMPLGTETPIDHDHWCLVVGLQLSFNCTENSAVGSDMMERSDKGRPKTEGRNDE